MISSEYLNDEDRALVEGDTPDLPSRDRKKIVLVQPTSPELVYGDKRYIQGASIGSFIIPKGDERVPVPSFTAIAVGFNKRWDEYMPDRGPYVASHDAKPADCIWLDAKRDGVKKTGYARQNGNRVQEVVAAYLLLGNGFGGVYDFYGSATSIGRDFADRAGRLKATVGGSDIHTCTVGMWGFKSRTEQGAEGRYCLPVPSLIGKLGEEGGPTLKQWRQAQYLRRAFKDGTPFIAALEDLAAPTALDTIMAGPPRPEMIRHGAPSRAMTPPDIGSGPARWDRDGPPAPPPPTEEDYGGHYPDEDEQSIPF
jgi:hypothetical protein